MTQKQMEQYVNHYWVAWRNSHLWNATEKEINEYKKSWEPGKANRRENIVKDNGIENKIGVWISFYVKHIYLQPVYYYEAVKMYPDKLPDEEKIKGRFDYLRMKGEFARDKYLQSSLSDYLKFEELIPRDDKKAKNDLIKILFFTESLIGRVPSNIYHSPIMADFITTMYELKKTYDILLPMEGFPRMNKYFDNVDVSKFQIDNALTEPLKKKSFIDYINHEKPELFAQKLKEEFAGSIGKEIALMIYVIRDHLIGHIVKKAFYRAMAEYFGATVGSDTSINKVLNHGLEIVDIDFMKNDHEKMKDRIAKIIKSL